MSESCQLPLNRTVNMDDDPEKRSITAPEADHEDEVQHVVPNPAPTRGSQITREKMLTTLIICFCNLINFMDRYSLPGKFRNDYFLFSQSSNLIILKLTMDSFYRNFTNGYRRFKTDQFPRRFAAIGFRCKLCGFRSIGRILG